MGIILNPDKQRNIREDKKDWYHYVHRVCSQSKSSIQHLQISVRTNKDFAITLGSFIACQYVFAFLNLHTHMY